MQHRVTVLLSDYRTIDGIYDKLVAIEMIEAVGWRDFPTFFRICSERLKDHGVMLLQAITIDDRAYEVERATRSFIKTTMFPGGCLPSVASLTHNMAVQGNLRLVHLEDITPHYVVTLRHWRERFAAAARRLDELGYGAPFRRRWLFYLAYCEAGFIERRIRDVQLLMAKPRYRGEGAWESQPPIASATLQAATATSSERVPPWTTLPTTTEEGI
jgi:cyclopropane-fatty-acyl-phospholipid synthase